MHETDYDLNELITIRSIREMQVCNDTLNLDRSCLQQREKSLQSRQKLKCDFGHARTALLEHWQTSSALLHVGIR